MSSKALKEQNKWQLWLLLAINVVVFYMVLQTDSFSLSDLRTFAGSASHFLPLGVATTVTTAANGLLSADAKARIVFLRWKHALPGHRAFSRYATTDSRINIDRLKVLSGVRFRAILSPRTIFGIPFTNRSRQMRLSMPSKKTSC